MHVHVCVYPVVVVPVHMFVGGAKNCTQKGKDHGSGCVCINVCVYNYGHRSTCIMFDFIFNAFMDHSMMTMSGSRIYSEEGR